MVIQDKNKYASPRYRLVVRITNRTVICQIVHRCVRSRLRARSCRRLPPPPPPRPRSSHRHLIPPTHLTHARSEIDGDRVLSSAYSSELPRYGLKVGLKNYAAAYATGLLVARRTLAKLGLAEAYPGNDSAGAVVVKTSHTNAASATREYWVKEVAEDRKPFRCVLDVGIAATTTGARIFGALKGAADGGLDIPHNEKRFPGYNRDDKKYKPETHRERIFGNHVGSYMEEVREEDPDAYAKHFSKYIEHEVEPDDMEELFKSVHAAIRADPSPAPKKAFTPNKSFAKAKKLTQTERKERVAKKKLYLAAQIAEKLAGGGAAAGGGDEDDE